MKEIGSFIELELPKGREWFNGEGVARLNTGRSAIFHASRLLETNIIWIPYYQCASVREFLLRKGCSLKYYHLDERFEPIDLSPDSNEVVLLVNYFGMMSFDRMKNLSSRYSRVIIDNCQAFFCPPVPGVMNVYSARKFMGVPDGAYVIGCGAERFVDGYPVDHSSDTAVFLLQRIEYGCEGKAYQSRMLNEERLDAADVMQMSVLTRGLLDAADYTSIQAKRKENFKTACDLFGDVNLLDTGRYADDGVVPMVYPLVVEDDSLLSRLLSAGHYQGRWWSYICQELSSDSFEYWLSRYMLPITIDQRYGKDDLAYIRSVVG